MKIPAEWNDPLSEAMTNKIREQAIENSDAYILLMNIPFKEREADHSDVGTFYLSSSGVIKILNDLESLGYENTNKEPKTAKQKLMEEGYKCTKCKANIRKQVIEEIEKHSVVDDTLGEELKQRIIREFWWQQFKRTKEVMSNSRNTIE